MISRMTPAPIGARTAGMAHPLAGAIAHAILARPICPEEGTGAPN